MGKAEPARGRPLRTKRSQVLSTRYAKRPRSCRVSIETFRPSCTQAALVKSYKWTDAFPVEKHQSPPFHHRDIDTQQENMSFQKADSYLNSPEKTPTRRKFPTCPPPSESQLAHLLERARSHIPDPSSPTGKSLFEGGGPVPSWYRRPNTHIEYLSGPALESLPRASPMEIWLASQQAEGANLTQGSVSESRIPTPPPSSYHGTDLASLGRTESFNSLFDEAPPSRERTPAPKFKLMLPGCPGTTRPLEPLLAFPTQPAKSAAPSIHGGDVFTAAPPAPAEDDAKSSVSTIDLESTWSSWSRYQQRETALYLERLAQAGENSSEDSSDSDPYFSLSRSSSFTTICGGEDATAARPNGNGAIALEDYPPTVVDGDEMRVDRDAFPPTQIHGFAPTQIQAVFPPTQIQAFAPTQIQGFPPTQIEIDLLGHEDFPPTQIETDNMETDQDDDLVREGSPAPTISSWTTVYNTPDWVPPPRSPRFLHQQELWEQRMLAEREEKERREALAAEQAAAEAAEAAAEFAAARAKAAASGAPPTIRPQPLLNAEGLMRGTVSFTGEFANWSEQVEDMNGHIRSAEECGYRINAAHYMAGKPNGGGQWRRMEAGQPEVIRKE
ncbi:hypothetical protein BOTBODRAFT_142298 [Botryobasidium botryosum FD-172 SS1]|uniref:Uncharacterized protein n=1 Tax=Botryobasidium botryosum (strain FD-172 SS1) TaxID=930990 RepID=A0A067NAU2_BOTB1|nr:hypothetical protein BOTBODRAFT_142298 [Botryobasidium botryosum FD-172 SS1]